jgi:hypothetical protein
MTQMHGVPLKKWMRWAILAAYIGGALIVYGLRDITMIHQVTWIPIIEYAGVLLLAALITLGLKIRHWLWPSRAPYVTESTSAAQ